MAMLIAMITSVAWMVGSLGVAHAAEKHLFYVHGCCIKGKDDPKIKAYEMIAQELRNAGFNLTFDLRYADMSDSDALVQAYAAKVADQVNALLAKGVMPEGIIVSGYSLGSMTTLVASGLKERGWA